MKKEIKRLFIKIIPTIWLLIALLAGYIEEEFRTYGVLELALIFISSSRFLTVFIHPIYLAICSYKERGTKFFVPYFEMLVLLLPYFIGLDKGDSFSRGLGIIICGGEYILTSILWVGVYTIKKYESVGLNIEECISEKRKRTEAILTNLIPILFIGVAQCAVCFESYLRGTERDLLYLLFYITEFVFLAGGLYYSRVNRALFGSNKKAVYTSLSMILSCLILQYFISIFAPPGKVFYFWLLFKYICQLVAWATVWSDVYLEKRQRGKTGNNSW